MGNTKITTAEWSKCEVDVVKPSQDINPWSSSVTIQSVYLTDIFPSMHLTSEQSGVDLIVMAFQTPSKHETSLD